MRQGQAGTLESNDAVITVAEAPAGSGIIIDLESSVKAAYGDAIEAVIRDACREAGIEDAEVDVRDKGALDCTIRARTHHETYAFVSAGKQPRQSAVRRSFRR